MRDESDEVLMLAYQKGEVRAFEILLGRHKRPIYNFFLRYVRIAALAEDLTQETFMRVIRGAAEYKQQAKFTTWLYTIARNLTVDNSRRAKHRNMASLEAPLGGTEQTLLDLLPAPGLATDRQVIVGELGIRLEQAIAKLPEEQKEVFLLREMSGLTFAEISEIVGVQENTIKSRMRYALEKLREELQEYEDVARALP